MLNNQLIKKLRLKPTYHTHIINPPIGYGNQLGLVGKSKGPFDFIHLFVNTGSELKRKAPTVLRQIQPDGVLWISYPKKSSSQKTDFNRDKCWEVMKTFGYRAVSQISIDETWSAMRFKPAEKVRSKKIETPYIDTIKRIVRIPRDLEIAFKKNKKAEEFFKSLSYTHRKEYVVWIESAKKEETRSARVTKTIDLLTKGIKDR